MAPGDGNAEDMSFLTCPNESVCSSEIILGMNLNLERMPKIVSVQKLRDAKNAAEACFVADRSPRPEDLRGSEA